jgi:hypothetical protein
MKNSQMFAIMGVATLTHQMDGWPGIALGGLYFVLAIGWLVRGN